MEIYFTIYNGDGDTIVTILSKEQLLERLDENYWGSDLNFLKKLESNDTNNWGGKLLIIKGEIVIPKPKKVVEEWSI